MRRVCWLTTPVSPRLQADRHPHWYVHHLYVLVLSAALHRTRSTALLKKRRAVFWPGLSALGVSPLLWIWWFSGEVVLENSSEGYYRTVGLLSVMFISSDHASFSNETSARGRCMTMSSCCRPLSAVSRSDYGTEHTTGHQDTLTQVDNSSFPCRVRCYFSDSVCDWQNKWLTGHRNSPSHH